MPELWNINHIISMLNIFHAKYNNISDSCTHNYWLVDEFCRSQISEHFVNFRDLFMGILNAQVLQLASCFAFISWSIWYKRNAAWLDSPSLLYSKIHADIIERLPEFQLAQDLPSYLMQPPSLVHWSSPPCLWFNANFDGAIFQDIAAPGLGVVIRDAETIIKSLNSDEVVWSL